MQPTLDPDPGHTGPPGAEREALRIQAAAVAAQQAALTEEEARLEARRGTLARQEAQLAAHLEERRRKLIETAEEAQAARVALARERAAHDRHAATTAAELEQARRELHQGQQELQAGRAHLAGLARRMKRRWHRSWHAERQAMRRREEALAADRRQLEKDTEKLARQRAELTQGRLRFNGEAELGRRELQAAREELDTARRGWQEQQAREHAALKERRRALDEVAAALTDGERELGDERHRWARKVSHLKREAEGLEARAQNQRRKVEEQQWHLAWLEQRLGEARAVATIPAAVVTVVTAGADAPATAPEDKANAAGGSDQPCCAAPRAEAAAQSLALRAARVEEEDRSLRERSAAVERLAEDVADQRLHLLEQLERAALAHRDWHREREAALADAEALIARLPEREGFLAARERALGAAEEEWRRRHEELHQLRQHLEGWAARLKAREAGWESERDRVLLEARGREQLAERHLAALAQLRQRWARRRRQEVDLTRAERAACERLRRECGALREELLRRGATLEGERRALAEKTLALEQHRQQLVIGSADAAAAERRVERLQRQWQALNAHAIRTASAAREALLAEATQLEQRQAALHKREEDLAAREAQLAQRQTAWEETQTLTDVEQARARQEVQSLQGQRDRYALHLNELQDEVERIARVLLEEPGPEALPTRAA